MRRSLAKVVKIRGDRASLPIAAYQDKIVRAVASNPCVLVAGDTGCGKSTQVLADRSCGAVKYRIGRGGGTRTGWFGGTATPQNVLFSGL